MSDTRDSEQMKKDYEGVIKMLIDNCETDLLKALEDCGVLVDGKLNLEELNRWNGSACIRK